MLEDQNPIGEYRWECPYTDCKFFLLQYTNNGFEEKIREHRDFHLRRMREERQEREKKLQELQKPWLRKLPEKVVELPAIKKDYNKLVLTLYDLTQFELHGIKVDEDCVIDGYDG